MRQHSAWIISARQRAGAQVTGVSSHHSVRSTSCLVYPYPHARPTTPSLSTPIPDYPQGEGGEKTQSSPRLLRCFVRQMFHLLSQLASFPRKTSSTGFHLLSLCFVGWGKGLSLCFDPPLSSLPLAQPGSDQSHPLQRVQVGGSGALPPGCAGLRLLRARSGEPRVGSRVLGCARDAIPMTELQQEVEEAKPVKVLGKREGKVGPAQ